MTAQTKTDFHPCDCGKPAYKKDGSGWFCYECEEWVSMIGRLQAQLIQHQRGSTPEQQRLNRNERNKEYRAVNYQRILVYQRMKYHRSKPHSS